MVALFSEGYGAEVGNAALKWLPYGNMVNVPRWQRPSSPAVPPQGAPGGSAQLGTSGAEAKPPGAREPLPRVLERDASKVSHSFHRLWPCSYGGLYVSGGIGAKNPEWVKGEHFMRAYADKGRLSPCVAQVPLYIGLQAGYT